MPSPSRPQHLSAYVALAAFGLVAALHGADGDAGLASIKADALKGHIYFLASDEMGGRDSLSPEGPHRRRVHRRLLLSRRPQAGRRQRHLLPELPDGRPARSIASIPTFAPPSARTG